MLMPMTFAAALLAAPPQDMRLRTEAAFALAMDGCMQTRANDALATRLARDFEPAGESAFGWPRGYQHVVVVGHHMFGCSAEIAKDSNGNRINDVPEVIQWADFAVAWARRRGFQVANDYSGSTATLDMNIGLTETGGLSVNLTPN